MRVRQAQQQRGVLAVEVNRVARRDAGRKVIALRTERERARYGMVGQALGQFQVGRISLVAERRHRNRGGRSRRHGRARTRRRGGGCRRRGWGRRRCRRWGWGRGRRWCRGRAGNGCERTGGLGGRGAPQDGVIAATAVIAPAAGHWLGRARSARRARRAHRRGRNRCGGHTRDGRSSGRRRARNRVVDAVDLDRQTGRDLRLVQEGRRQDLDAVVRLLVVHELEVRQVALAARLARRGHDQHHCQRAPEQLRLP